MTQGQTKRKGEKKKTFPDKTWNSRDLEYMQFPSSVPLA